MKEQLLNLLYILTVMLPLFPGGVMVRFQTVQDRRLACHCPSARRCLFWFGWPCCA